MIDACILAGGRATRLGGRAKPALTKDGATILERQLAVLAPRAHEILIAIARGSAPLPVPPGARVRFVEDDEAGAGPLAGITAALTASAAPWLLVIAGDLPHLAGGLVDLLTTSITEEVDAIVPRVRGLPEPLLALYRRQTVAAFSDRLRTGRRKVSAVLDDLRVRWLDEPALREVDPSLASFVDVDTPDDLERWRDH